MKLFGEESPSDLFFLYILVPSFIIILIYPVLIKIKDLVTNVVNYITEPKRKQKEYDEKYNKLMEIYISESKNDLDRVDKELIEQAILVAEANKLNEIIKNTKQALYKLYDKGIVYEKYRSIIPLCSFLDYLKSGRCNRLEGYDGAYNLYENEVKLDTIITKLDNIACSIDRLSRTQYSLYRSIEESTRGVERLYNETRTLASNISNTNTNLDSINRNISQITENTAITAYNSNVIANEIHNINLNY